MLLTKDGITVDVTHPADIARYKHLGYVEVVAEPKIEKPKIEKGSAEKVPENAPKGGNK